MILMPQIFDVTANENVRYKRNELELDINKPQTHVVGLLILSQSPLRSHIYLTNLLLLVNFY